MPTPYAIVRRFAEPGMYLGARGEPLRGVEAGGLTLLVGDRADPIRDAEAFMDAVCAIHEDRACVPMRLGEPLADDDAGLRLIETGGDRFARLLDRLEGADEWSVTVRAPECDVAVATPSASGAGATGRGYLERRRREMDERAGMHPAVSDLLGGLSRALAPMSRDVRTIPLAARGGSLALLVDRERDIAPAFQAAADGAGLPCVLSGPWPAFSFVTIG